MNLCTCFVEYSSDIQEKAAKILIADDNGLIVAIILVIDEVNVGVVVEIFRNVGRAGINNKRTRNCDLTFVDG
jgi:hypothetical protein